MSVRTRTLLIVIVGAAIAAGAGLYLAGFIGGGKEKVVKQAMDPITLQEPFIINLADPGQQYYVKMNVALEVEKMSPEDKHLFEAGAGGGGHGGGGDELTGALRVAQYPKFRDAVIEVTSGFTYAELTSKAGKERLKTELLHRFDEIAEKDAGPKSDGAHHDVSHAPFHIANVYFSEFAVQ